MGKLACWWWFSVTLFLSLTVLPVLFLLFLPDVTLAYWSTIGFFKPEYLGQDGYQVYATIHGIFGIIIYFVSLTELFRGYDHLYKKLIVFRTTQGQFTTLKETKRLKRKIIRGITSFIFFKSYLAGILVLSGLTNGLFYWGVAEEGNKGLAIALGFFFAAFVVSQLCGDYDEKLIQIEHAAEQERRNRAEYEGMNNYVQDSRYYYQPQSQHSPDRYYQPPRQPQQQQHYQAPPPQYQQPYPQSEPYVPPADRHYQQMPPPQQQQPQYQQPHYQEQAPPQSLDQVIGQHQHQTQRQRQHHQQQQEAYYDSDWETGQGQNTNSEWGWDNEQPQSLDRVVGQNPPRARSGGGFLKGIFKHNKKRPF